MKELVQIRGTAEVNRRELLRLVAGGIAALEVGCLAEPGDDVVPYVVDPPETRPGTPLRYATTLTLDGYAQGVIVETRDGRPVKIDGNPAHPATLGASTPAMQARILDLYDPQRAKELMIAGEPVSWERVRGLLGRARGRVWIVMPPTSSASVAMLLERIRERCELHVVWDAPVGHHEALTGHRLALGEAVEALPDLEHADVIATLDSDWLATMPGWARRAGARRAQMTMWTCEPAPTPTGTLADERLAVRARDVVAVAAVLAGFDAPLDPDARAWAERLRQALARGRGAIIVGDRQPAIVHALARLADTGARYVRTPLVDTLGGDTLADLAAALRARTVDALIVLDANPVYTAPRALDLATLVPDARLALCAGLHPNETARICHVAAPLAHELEAWGDARAIDGTRSLAQPAIRPRFAVVSPLELLSALAGDHRDPRLLVRDASGLDEPAWRAALARGAVDGSAEPPHPVTANRAAVAAELPRALVPQDGIEIALAASRVHDGRFGANAWLQELPHPLTKQTWGNAAVISPATADALGACDGQLLRIDTSGGHVEAPVVVVPGCVDHSITLELGYGRVVPELPIAHGVGANGFALRSSDALVLVGLAVPLHRHVELARTQHEFSDQGRDVAPQRADHLEHLRGAQPSLLPEPSHAGWGMTIDTSICTGCSACMVACQAENNLAIVGADQVRRGRHMNWIRVDLYRDDAGEVVNQPVPCQHCENAPCEYVCPVEATVHSPDGLNEMVYNRCVGTRFCSNNCPYKVRRFNWFAFERNDETALQYNPDVTVRSRGVMEKCTYCVQRIRRAEITARVEDRGIAPGEVVTACMQACPTGAIQFGNLAEQDTPFAHSRRDPRRYDLLHDLGTRPRTIYLAKVRK
jgi:molybdopterin-containing oxidoreductase family iron-sulfur binding subunit